jgi:hypothetical protein
MKDSVPVAFNIEPAYVGVSKWGNLSATVWNADEATRANTSSVVLGASETTGSKIHFMVNENDNDEAARGIIVLIKYDLGELSDVEIEGVTSGTSAVEDSTQVINQFNMYQKAFRLYRNSQPLTLDKDSRTENPSEAEFIIELKATTSDPSFELTIQPIDSDRYLAASGTQIKWANDGKFMGQNDALAEVGISATYETNSTQWGNKLFVVE